MLSQIHKNRLIVMSLVLGGLLVSIGYSQINTNNFRASYINSFLKKFIERRNHNGGPIATTTPATNTLPRLKVSGKYLLDNNGQKIVLKGYNWGWWGTAQETDAKDNLSKGANVVRMPIRWYFEGTANDIRQTDAPGHIKPEGLVELDKYIKWATDNKVWVILFAGSDLGAGTSDANYWTDPALKQEFKEMWTFLIERYKNTPYIAAYEILSEPHPPKPYTNKDVLSFYEEMISEIRKHDSSTPLIIGPNNHYDLRDLSDAFSAKYSNLIYTFNFYEPNEYVKSTKYDGVDASLDYPGNFTEKKTGKVIYLDKNYLRSLIVEGYNFSNTKNVPVFVNQIGIRSGVNNSLNYMSDTLDLMDEYGIGYTFWTYRVTGDINDMGIYYLDRVTKTWGYKADWENLLSKHFRNK